MGRRRAAAAAASATDAPSEEPVARRSSRLAQKPVVDYNENRMFKEAFSRAAVPKKAAPRRTKKDKETKLSSKGSVPRVSYLERTTHETILTASKPVPSTNNSARAASMASVTSRASTVLSIDQAVSTPVSSRKGAPKAARGGRVRKLATVDEDAISVASSSNGTSGQASGGMPDRHLLKRVHKPATVTPDTTQVIDPDPLRLRPVKQGSRKEKSASPDEQREVAGTRQPRGTMLFPVEEEEEGDDRDGLLLARPGSPPVVPEKKRKQEVTVATKKDTVAKETAARKKRKNGRGLSIILERIMREDTVEPQIPPSPPRAIEDDMFAGEITQGPGALDQSLSYLDLYNEGKLAIEDIPEEERELCLELGCPPSPTPTLDECLRSARPLILSTSSPESRSRNKRKTRKRLGNLPASESGDEEEEEEDLRDDPTWGHVAGGRRRRPAAVSPSPSSTSSTSSSSSKRRRDHSFAAEIAEMDASRLHAARYQRSKHVQAAFKNYKGTAGKKQKELASAAAKAQPGRKGPQWAAIAAPPPLPSMTSDDDEDEDEEEEGDEKRETVVSAANKLRRQMLPYM